MKFHISAVLSVSTGLLMTNFHPDWRGNKDNNGIGAMYELLNYMTADNLYTHQLGRGAEEARYYLPEWSKPDLAWLEQARKVASEDRDLFMACLQGWYADMVAQHGEWHEIEPIPVDDHDVIDPLTELQQMRPDMPIITFSPEETQDDEPSPYGDINW